MRTAILALALTTALSSCETESPAGYSTRETLPNGAVLVRYPDLPAIDAVGPDVTEAQLDLQFGSVDGTDPNLIFADIRGIQAASDGTIDVLDFQATQVAGLIDPGGQYLRTVVRRAKDRASSVQPTGSFSRATRCCGYTITASGRSSGSTRSARRCTALASPS